MTAFPGYGAQVSASGVSTFAGTQACVNIDGGAWKKYQITSVTKRVWDPTTSVTVFVDGVAQASSLYTVNRLFGSVTFISPLTSGNVVTVSIHWLAMAAVAASNSFEFSATLASQDATTFASNGWTERQGTLVDTSGNIGRFTQLDGLFQTALEAGTLMVISYFSKASNANPDFRCWALFNKHDLKGDPASLQTAQASWVGSTDPEGRQVAVGP